jgi:hypothetical protein
MVRIHEQIFTVKETIVLQRATTYAELAKVALTQLGRMWHESVTRPGIVCGPISNGGLGSKEKNIARFEYVVNEMTAKKHGCFFNQIPYEESLWRVQALLAETDKTVHPKGAGNPLLEGFYRPIFTSGLIGSASFIKGWPSSDGSVWERELCLEQGISVFDLDDDLKPTLFKP